MASFALRAAVASAVATDFEVFRSALRAGLDVEQCAAITAATPMIASFDSPRSFKRDLHDSHQV
jgi:hypothetical protein